MRFRTFSQLSSLSGLAAALLLSMSCERIEPVPTGPDLAEGEVLFTCESCHIDRGVLRRLAIAEDTGGGGGGG